MLRHWIIVSFGNLFGALGLVLLIYLSHHLDMNLLLIMLDRPPTPGGDTVTRDT